MKNLWTRKLCVSSKQTTLLFGSLQSEVICNLQVKRTLSDIKAKMAGQVRKKFVQNCFHELDEHFTVRSNLHGQDELGWESAEHKSSSFFRDEQLCSLRNSDLRSFTISKQPRKIQASFWPNSFGKFGPTHPSSTQTRVLDVNPSLFLAREVQLPLIYMRGDGRLNNNTQSQKTNLQTFPALVFASRSSTFFVLESFDLRSPRGGRTDLGQPITTVRPDGVSPGHVGFRVPKELVGCLAYRASGEPPPTTCPTYRARHRRYTVTCSCANTLFGDSTGDDHHVRQ
jgi:hypothetical protein